MNYITSDHDLELGKIHSGDWTVSDDIQILSIVSKLPCRVFKVDCVGERDQVNQHLSTCKKVKVIEEVVDMNSALQFDYKTFTNPKFPLSPSFSEATNSAFLYWIANGFINHIVAFCRVKMGPILIQTAKFIDKIDLDDYKELDSVWMKTEVYPSVQDFSAAYACSQLPLWMFPAGLVQPTDHLAFAAATTLWESGCAPIFDGLTWRLHSHTGIESVILPRDIEKIDS